MTERVTFKVCDRDARVYLDVHGDVLDDLAPHLTGKFAVHPCAFHPDEWKVSHVDSGAFVAWGDERDEAVTIARLTLAHVDQAKLDAALAKAREKKERANTPPIFDEALGQGGCK